jgi:hypothetical protein
MILMRNMWIQKEDPFATWVADLGTARDRPDALLDFVAHVARVGERERVFTVLEAPAIDYLRERDGELPAFVEDIYLKNQVVDLFGFTGAAMKPGAPLSSTVEATLAWYDSKDQLVEGACVDVGALLRSLEPAPGSIPNGFTVSYPAVRMTGHRLGYGGDAKTLANRSDDARVRLCIHSDIWFPWIWGSAHPERDYERMFDNRELSRRHTPRLNRFLSSVGSKTREVGGTWYVDAEATGKDAILWLDDGGVFLEPEQPALQMPVSALKAEWY